MITWERRFEATTDALHVMQEQEMVSYRQPEANPYKVEFPSDVSSFVGERWRLTIARWYFDVIDHFGFERDVVCIAFHYLDRMVVSLSYTDESSSTLQHTPKKELQLMAITSLYLAIKLHGVLEEQDSRGGRKSLRAYAFVVLSNNLFDQEAIEQMELRLLFTLQWRLNPPTPLRFLVCLFPLIPAWTPSSAVSSTQHEEALGVIFNRAKYLTEIAVCTSDLSLSFKPSVVAFAAILCGMEDQKESGSVVLPRRAQRAFLKNVARHTSLHDSMLLVKRVCQLLREDSPIAVTSEVHSSSQDKITCQSKQTLSHQAQEVRVCTPIHNKKRRGKKSPICVSDFDKEVRDDNSLSLEPSRRKRQCRQHD